MDAIKLEKIHKSFGKNKVLKDLNLSIPKGCIFGLLGRNAAGKTTTIKIILGIIKADRGLAQVNGLDSNLYDYKIRQDIGYISENQQLYEWMTVKEILWFSSKFYKNWDHSYEKELVSKFGLEENAKIKTLSRGTKAKLCLTLAMAHKPEILILDEATSGLDAIVRREFLNEIIEFVQKENMTVLISSHLLIDMERVVENICFLDEGFIKINDSLANLKKSFRKIQFTFKNPIENIELPGMIYKNISGRQGIVIVKNYSEKIKEAINSLEAKEIEYVDMTLEELFSECMAIKG